MNKTVKSILINDYFRYDNKPSKYIRIFLVLFRNAHYSKNRIIKSIYRFLYYHHRIKRGLEISSNVNVGMGLYIGHAFDITINDGVTMGKNINIHKGVTIGQENRGQRKGCPTIKDNVWIGVNSTIVGKIVIGDDVMIAPNSFVNFDVPSHSIVVGNPGKIIHRDNATEGYINDRV